MKTDKGFILCIVTIAGFTWLNPHVWLDMVMIIGASAQASPMDMRPYFLGGVTLASAVWFLSLGYGARYLRPYFEGQRAWQFIDGCTAIMMIVIAFNLLVKLLA